MSTIPNSNIRVKKTNGKWADRVTICQEAGDSVPVEFAVSTSTINIINKTIASSATEESQALVSGTKQLEIRVRSPKNAILQISFVSGESGTKFMTIPARNSFSLKDINLQSETLYVQSNENNTVVEIVEIS